MQTTRPDLTRAERVAQALAAATDQTHPAGPAAELQDIFDLGGSLPTDAHGTIDTRVTVLVLPAEQVRRLLPSGLELAPQPVVPSGWHPVYVLSSHDNFSAWFGDMDYEEMMIAVPYVQISEPYGRYPGPYIYMPRLYLNAAVPRELGVHLYGWEKQAATITSTTAGAETKYVVTAEGATAPTVTGTFREIAGLGPQPPRAYANFTIVRQLFEQPTISQALHVAFPDAFTRFAGPFFATTVLYQVDQPGTTVQAIEAELVVGESLTPPGIPPGTYRTPGLDTAQLGSFRLQCKQFVTLPGGCRSVNFPRPPAERRLKVAVLGGGPAACTAALYLARQRDRYEVSLYTTGFRLGGKCQSWRNPAKAWRIEEHGLHAFLGFYHNAFTAVQDAYLGAFPDDGLGQALYGQAFHAEPYNGVMVKRDDVWSYCATPTLSTSAKSPGTDDLQSGHALLLAMEGALARAVDHLAAIGHEHPLLGRTLTDARQELERAAANLRSSAGAATKRQAPTSADLLDGIAADVLIALRDTIAAIVRLDEHISTYAWFLWTGVDTLLTIVIGLLRHPVRNLSELDGWDFREWLRANGLAERGDERWSVVDQVYETLFAHQPAPAGRPPCAPIDGEVHAASLACGVATRWFLLESTGALGTPAYRFRYSCAQTIMTPLYLALERLGAKVNFFHTVTGLELTGSGEERRICGVRLQRQAEVCAGPDAYAPLIREPLPNNPPELPDWPMDPDYAQLVDGEWFREHRFDFFDAWQADANPHARPALLRAGADFDLVVLGVPLGALPLIDSPLTSPVHADPDPAWRRMIDGIAVTQTMSFQLWLNVPSSSLLAEPRGLLTAFAQPEPSYGDFTPLITYEDWPDPKPQYVAYFTGASYSGKPPLPPQCGPDYPQRMQAAWSGKVHDWLSANYAAFYDGQGTPRSFDRFLDLLAVEGEVRTPAQRLEWQHLIADVQPSNLYVLSQPGATALRLGQAESGVGGLILCGDWTRTDMNCGCVEAATSSGMLAARAISNEPADVWRTGF